MDDSQPRQLLHSRRCSWISGLCEIVGLSGLQVFINVVRGRPGGLLQFSKEEAVKTLLSSVSSGIHTMQLNREG